MSDVVECFLVRPTSRARRGLRRYSSSGNPAPSIPPCASTTSTYHNAIVWLDEVHAVHERAGGVHLEQLGADRVETFAGDPRWPAHCERCGYAFRPTDTWQVFWTLVYARTDDPRVTMTLQDPLPGAMYFADWYPSEAWCSGPDGRALMVVLPNGHIWHVDGTASNCDSPCKVCGHAYSAHYPRDGSRRPFECLGFLEGRPHKCWVRHGNPPLVTVDKNGVTCHAGGGSIDAPSRDGSRWHGFLTNGQLRQV